MSRSSPPPTAREAGSCGAAQTDRRRPGAMTLPPPMGPPRWWRSPKQSRARSAPRTSHQCAAPPAGRFR
eukprot:1428566-Alexandrium_andersonii.AAC.1